VFEGVLFKEERLCISQSSHKKLFVKEIQEGRLVVHASWVVYSFVCCFCPLGRYITWILFWDYLGLNGVLTLSLW